MKCKIAYNQGKSHTIPEEWPLTTEIKVIFTKKQIESNFLEETLHSRTAPGPARYT